MTNDRDILQFLKVDLRFWDNVAEWDGSKLPFEDDEATLEEACHTVDGDVMDHDNAASHAKRILDAKCQKTDLEDVCRSQTESTAEQQIQLETLLCKCEMWFNVQQGHWQDQEVKLELKEGAKPCHSCAHNIA